MPQQKSRALTAIVGVERDLRIAGLDLDMPGVFKHADASLRIVVIVVHTRGAIMTLTRVERRP